jgi:hypothetical protein
MGACALFFVLILALVGGWDEASANSTQEASFPTPGEEFFNFEPTATEASGRHIPERRLLSDDGKTVSFHSYGEAVEFLMTAELVSTANIPVGVTKPLKLLLGKDGKQAHAVFHHIDVQKPRARSAKGKAIRNFLDSYRSQVAAYELSRLLGIDSVPPTVERQIGKRTGSVQLWLEGVITEKKRFQSKYRPSNADYYRQQIEDKNIFHSLIHNTDPNQGNILWDRSANIWLIDHTRSFSRNVDLLRPLGIRSCSRGLWEGLNSVDLESLTEKLSPYIGKYEIRALENRRQQILEILGRRIENLGQENVLFDYGGPSLRYTYRALPDDPTVADAGG